MCVAQRCGLRCRRREISQCIKCQIGWCSRDGAYHNRAESPNNVRWHSKKMRKINKSFDRRALPFSQSINYRSQFSLALSPNRVRIIFTMGLLFSYWINIHEFMIELNDDNTDENWLRTQQFIRCDSFVIIWTAPWLLRHRAHTFVVSMSAFLVHPSNVARTHCLLFYAFISNDEILFPFDRFRSRKEKKMFRRSTTITHTIITIKLIRDSLFFWVWHKIDWTKIRTMANCGSSLWFARAHTPVWCMRLCTPCAARRTREILFQCAVHLWRVAAASLHVRLFDAALKLINRIIIIIMHCTCADIWVIAPHKHVSRSLSLTRRLCRK